MGKLRFLESLEPPGELLKVFVILNPSKIIKKYVLGRHARYEFIFGQNEAYPFREAF